MTNFSLSSALKFSALVVAAGLLGCDSGEKPPATADDFVDLAAAKLAAGDLGAAAAAVSNAVELAGGDVDVRLLKAQVDFNTREYESARKIYRAIAEDASLDRETRSQGWAGLGVVDYAAQDHHAARCDFLRAIRLDARNAAARYHLGLLYRDIFGFNEAALDQFQLYVRVASEIDERVKKVQQTVIPELKEMVQRMVLDIPGARDRDPGTCSKALNAAEAAMKKGTFKTARLRYEEAVKADPTSYPAVTGLARAYLKTDASATGMRKAIENYLTACKLKPSSTQTYFTAGELAAKAGQHGIATEVYSRAMAADPTSTTAIDGLIRALRKTNFGKAAAVYQSYRDSLAKKK